MVRAEDKETAESNALELFRRAHPRIENAKVVSYQTSEYGQRTHNGHHVLGKYEYEVCVTGHEKGKP